MLRFPGKLNTFLGKYLGESYYRWIIERELARPCSHDPILIWQMGKVGSSTVLASLRQHLGPNRLFHLHLLSDAMIAKGEMRQKALSKRNKSYLYNVAFRKILLASLAKGQKWKIVTLVREPVGRNLSSYFQNLDLYYPVEVGGGPDICQIPLSSLMETFLNRFDHDRPLEWFDEEMRGVLGLDVFGNEFPKKIGYQIHEKGSADILVVRMEDLDRVAKEAFGRFLCIPDFELIRRNVGLEKGYARIYRALRSNIAVPVDYLNRSYNSKYFRHFYTEDESENFRAKWQPPTTSC